MLINRMYAWRGYSGDHQPTDDPNRITLTATDKGDVVGTLSIGIDSEVGLMADEIAVVGLEHSPFIEMPGVIAMTPEHPLAQCATVSPEAMVQHDFIVLNPEDASRRRLEGMLAERGLALRPVLETPYAFSVCELVLRGMGIGLIHPMTAVDYLPRGLVIKRLDIDVAFRSLLVFRPGKPLSQNARDLLSLMRIQAERDLAVIKHALR